MEYKEQHPSARPDHYYCSGDSTYFILRNRFGNNLSPVEYLLTHGGITAEQANQDRMTFINTLRQAIEQEAPEEKGVTRKMLQELVDVISVQDWSNMDDVKKAIKRTSEIFAIHGK